MRFMDSENLGRDLTGRYFRSEIKEHILKEENAEFELPKVSASDAFDEPESQIPF
jgi:hypothetical protein